MVVVVETRRVGMTDQDMVTELRLAHFSVKEYLTSDWLGKDTARYFEDSIAKASITKFAWHTCRISMNSVRSVKSE